MKTSKKVLAQEAARPKPGKKKDAGPNPFTRSTGRSVEDMESERRWVNARAVVWDSAGYEKRYGVRALKIIEQCRAASRDGDMRALIKATHLFPASVLGV